MFHIGLFSIDGGVIAMIDETPFSQEGAVTGRARVSGSGIAFVRAVGLETRGTFFTQAGVMMIVVVFKTGFTVDAKVIATQKSRQGITSVIVLVDFDEHDTLVSRGSFENDSVVVIEGEDDDLVIDEMSLKSSEFG